MFVHRGSAQVFAVVSLTLLAVRAVIGQPDRGDVIVIGATIMIAGPVVWVIHNYRLHADDAAWAARVLGTGDRHREHHLDPPVVDWIFVQGSDAVVFVTAFGVVTAAWTVPLMWATGSATAGPFVTALACAALGLLHYEWVHLLAHTRYRCRNRYYSRLARNHRLHHYRNEEYWLGVTTNSGDRLFGTYPHDKSAVPLSETARTLA